MLRASCLFLLVLLTGCAPTSQDRLRDYSEDGLHLYRQGAYGEAREHFLAALTLRPGDPDLTYNLARCNDRMGRVEEAERLYKDCLARSGDHAAAQHGYTMLLVNTGRQREAVQIVETWLRARPKLAGPYVEDGWLRTNEGDLDSARARYQQALDIEPRNPRALIELARVFEKLDRPDRAVVLYERALEANPDQPAIARHVSDLRSRGVGRPHPD
jgi:tetratricopeptide (TPR) repeat protein